MLTAPPFSTHKRLPLLLNATDCGNSPSEETGFPICWMFVGFLESMENRESVFEPL